MKKFVYSTTEKKRAKADFLPGVALLTILFFIISIIGSAVTLEMVTHNPTPTIQALVWGFVGGFLFLTCVGTFLLSVPANSRLIIPLPWHVTLREEHRFVIYGSDVRLEDCGTIITPEWLYKHKINLIEFRAAATESRNLQDKYLLNADAALKTIIELKGVH
jgi:hypothetical protein